MAIREQVISDFIGFSKQSFEWCTRESEKEVYRINEILHFVIDDTRRRIKMSDKAKKALTDISDLYETKNPKTGVKNIVLNLKDIMAEEENLSDSLSPIIHALQFQDRYCQNLENLVKMLEIWNEFRARKDCDIEEFGKALADVTTMVEERDILRTYFKTIPEESSKQQL